MPSGHLKALKGDEGKVPIGVYVFLGQAGSPTQSSYLQSMNWEHLYSSKNAIIGGAVGAYKIGVQFGRLLSLVAFTPSPYATFATAAGIHVPMNPSSMMWPSYLYTPKNATELPIWTFTRSLALAMGPK